MDRVFMTVIRYLTFLFLFT